MVRVAPTSRCILQFSPSLFLYFEMLTTERLDLKMKCPELSAYEIRGDEFSYSHLKDGLVMSV